MKKIGFRSFGPWAPSPQSETQLASDALLQSIDLAIETERLGVMNHTSVFITSRGNWRRHFHFLLR